MTPPNDDHIDTLTQVLQRKVPAAQLSVQTLPLVPEIKLALIESRYPQADLSAEHVAFLMDSPPYWAFCWASGQVMARYLLDHPSNVKGKTVVDFGCGSGVVAIAAKLAGASTVIALDIDEAALLATRVNAELNHVDVQPCTRHTANAKARQQTILLVADVFYDAENIPMLSAFIQNYHDVIVADSRVKSSALNAMVETARYASSTVPDLGESADFNSVGVYRLMKHSVTAVADPD